MRGIRICMLLAAWMGVMVFASSGLHAQTDAAVVTSRPAVIDNVTVGEVLVNDTVVLRLREPAGGLTTLQRATIVADRLRALLGQGHTWQNVTVGMMNNEVVLLMGGQLLVTVDRRHAQLNNTTPLNLAYDWQNRTQVALRDARGVVTPVEDQWPDWTGATSRVVPIISVGTPGLRLGFAQVMGPRARVDRVDAVLQLDADFQGARARVFVPSSSLTALNRVQGVAVSALLQYPLLDF